MTQLRSTRFLMMTLAAIAVAIVVVALPPGAGQATHSSSTVELVAVDPAIDGNTATLLGPVDSCFQIAPGSVVDVDVIVNAIPADRPVTAFQFDLFYNPAIVHVVGFNSSMLLAAQPGSNVLPPLTDPIPDSDGGFQAAALDFGASTETGPGVLSRITLEAVGTGVTPLSPSTEEVLIYDDRNERLTVNSLGAAYLAVGEACPAGQPAPLAAAPGATPDSEAPTPAPAAEGTASGSPAPGEEGGASPTPGPEEEAGSSSANDVNSSAGSSSGSDDGNNGDSFPVWLIVLIAVIAVAVALGLGAYLYRRRLR